MIWLELHTDPPLIFYDDPADIPYMEDYLRFPVFVSCGTLRDDVSLSGQGANPALDIRLECTAQLRGLLRIPPYRVTGILKSRTRNEFTGIVRSVSYDVTTYTIRLEA